MRHTFRIMRMNKVRSMSASSMEKVKMKVKKLF